MNRRETYLVIAGILLASIFLVLTAGPLPDAQVAVLDSALTKQYFADHYRECDLSTSDPNALGGMEYKRYWGGWEEVLKELQQADSAFSYNVVDDTFVNTRLLKSSYKVLVLANNIGLSSAETDSIRKWVANGGRLLATFGSGYEATASSVDEALASRTDQETLQQLWNDPLTKYVATGSLGMDPPVAGSYSPGSVEPMITRSDGPVAKVCQFYDPINGACPWYFYKYRLVTGYGDLANMLVGRSENDPGAYAYFGFANNLAIYDAYDNWPDTKYSKPLPAIIGSRYGKGYALYYAFAPEFIVGLEYDVAGHCATDPNYPGESAEPGIQSTLTWANNRWAGRTPELRAMMESGLDYLRQGP